MENSPRIVDMRYSLVPNEVDPMWGIDIALQSKMPMSAGGLVENSRNIKQRKFVGMLLGVSGIPLPAQEATP